MTGYPGTGEEKLAMERGEIEAMSLPWTIIKNELAQWLRDKTISLLVQTGADKNPGLSDLPNMIDLGRNDDDRALLSLFSTPSTIGRSVSHRPACRQSGWRSFAAPSPRPCRIRHFCSMSNARSSISSPFRAKRCRPPSPMRESSRPS